MVEGTPVFGVVVLRVALARASRGFDVVVFAARDAERDFALLLPAFVFGRDAFTGLRLAAGFPCLADRAVLFFLLFDFFDIRI